MTLEVGLFSINRAKGFKLVKMLHKKYNFEECCTLQILQRFIVFILFHKLIFYIMVKIYYYNNIIATARRFVYPSEVLTHICFAEILGSRRNQKGKGKNKKIWKQTNLKGKLAEWKTLKSRKGWARGPEAITQQPWFLAY